MCAFEISPRKPMPDLSESYWMLAAEDRADRLSANQRGLLGKTLMIREMAAFSRRPGVVRVYRAADLRQTSSPHEVLQFSLSQLSLRWPETYRISMAQIETDGLALSVQYDNNVRAEPDEKVLIVLGGTFQ